MFCIATDLPTLIEVYLKRVFQLFTHLKINSVKLHLQVHKSLSASMLVPKMVSTYIGLIFMTLDPATVIKIFRVASLLQDIQGSRGYLGLNTVRPWHLLVGI